MSTFNTFNNWQDIIRKRQQTNGYTYNAGGVPIQISQYGPPKQPQQQPMPQQNGYQYNYPFMPPIRTQQYGPARPQQPSMENSMPSSFYANRTPAVQSRPSTLPPSTRSPSMENAMPASFYANRTPESVPAPQKPVSQPAKQQTPQTQTTGDDAFAAFEKRKAIYDEQKRLSEELRKTTRARVEAARSGDSNAVESQRAVENEIRGQLASLNRLRNTGRAIEAEKSDKGGVKRAELLDSQLGDAIVAGNQSQADAIRQRMEFAQRYNIPGMKAQADQQALAFAEQSANPLPSPTYFADRAGNGPTIEELTRRMENYQRMYDSYQPSDAYTAAQGRGFRTESQAKEAQLRSAMQDAAIQQVENSSVGQNDDAYAQVLGFAPGTSLTPEMRQIAQRILMNRTTSALGQSESQAKIDAALGDSTASFVASSAASSVGEFIANPNSADAQRNLMSSLDAIDAIQDPAARAGAIEAVKRALSQGGATVSDLNGQPQSTLGTMFWNTPNPLTFGLPPRFIRDPIILGLTRKTPGQLDSGAEAARLRLRTILGL